MKPVNPIKFVHKSHMQTLLMWSQYLARYFGLSSRIGDRVLWCICGRPFQVAAVYVQTKGTLMDTILYEYPDSYYT